MIFKLIGIIALCSAFLLLICALFIYGAYGFLTIKDMLAPDFEWPSLAQAAPSAILVLIIAFLFISGITAIGIRFMSYRKGTKHFTITFLRWLFLASIGGIMVSFFVSLIFLQHYMLKISAHAPQILCMRVSQETLSPKDIYLFLGSAERCEAFKQGAL